MKKIIDYINKLPNPIIFVLFTITLTVFYSLMYNVALFKNHYPIEYLFLLIMISFARDAVIWYIIALNRWVFLILTPILFLFGSGLNYFVINANMGIGIGVFEMLFNTNVNEALGVIHTDLIISLILSLIFSAIFIAIRFFIGGVKGKKMAFIFLIIFLLPVFLGKLPEDDLKEVKYGKGAATERGVHIMPEKILENFYHYALNQFRLYKMLSDRKDIVNFNVDYIDDKNNPDTIIFILTDALRPDHMQVNGYERPTTPYLMSNGYISYADMYACETSTTRSVPCLITRATRGSNQFQYLKEPSILSMFKNAGFHTAWISSQGSITTADYGANVVASDADYSFFNNSGTKSSITYDSDLLPILDNFLKSNDKKKFVVLHLNGSHWNYITRYPPNEKVWTPECNNWVYDCSIEEVINTYDNTIVATDKFFNGVIELIKDKNSIIFFSSDHGQFLGEKGLRLHSHEMLHHKEVGVVPFGVWLSDKAKNNPFTKVILNNKYKITSHDNIFHSISHCGGLKSNFINEDLSICSENLKSLNNEFE